MVRYLITSVLILFSIVDLLPQSSGAFSIARLKFGGGADWYNDPSAEVNLLNYIKNNTNIKVDARYQFVDLASDEIYAYPLLFMTGHGNVVFTDEEARRLRVYLENGGFLFIDDDYGMDKALRREMKKVFPEGEFVELPFSHPVYNIVYKFENGVPKTHKHDEKSPQGFGIFIGERLVVYYTYESNPSDGWADADIHNNSPEVRETALKFGTNIVVFALSQPSR